MSAADQNSVPGKDAHGTLRDKARELVRRLRAADHEAFWVGGCVRDQLRGLAPKDYDIATSARPEEVEALFPHTIPVGRQFGVIIVLVEGRQFEIATFRTESGYQDGRRPDHVTFANARADAQRRDFTVNGLYYDPLEERLHDWVGGAADLEARVLRTIGAPAERFGEDHLRLLRAVRFSAQLDFTIEPATFAALRLGAPQLASVSAERIRDELLKIFRPPHAARGLELLHESGLLAQVLPEIEATVSCEQSPDYHPEGSVFNHLRLMLARLPADAAPSLPWAVLLHDVAKPLTAQRDPVSGSIRFYEHERIGAELAGEILCRLRFPRRQIEEIVVCVRQHMQFKDVKQMRKSTLRRLLLRPTFALELELHRLDCLGSHGRLDHFHFLQEEAAQLAAQPALRPPLLTGADLIALGMTTGPVLGDVLAEIRELQLQDELTTPEAARTWARQRLAAGQPPPAQ